MYVPIAIGVMLALISLGAVAMVGFGIKNVIQGKQEASKILVFLVPAAIFGVSYVLSETVAEAAMLTMLLTMALLAVMLVITGIRTTFKF